MSGSVRQVAKTRQIDCRGFGQPDQESLDVQESLFNQVATDLAVAMRDWWTPDETFLSVAPAANPECYFTMPQAMRAPPPPSGAGLSE